MARTYNLAIKYSTKKMVAKAYREYCSDASQKYAMLMDVINDTVSTCEADKTPSDVVNSVLQKYSNFGIDGNDNVTFGNGVFSLFSFLNSLARSTIEQLNSIDTGVDSDINTEIVTTDLDGTPVRKKIDELMEELNANYHSVIVEEAAATAYDIGGNISEMITTARDVIASKFTSAYTDVSNSLSDCIEKIRSGYSIIDYVTSRMETSGVNGIVSGILTSFNQSEDCSYTGASPLFAFSWASVQKKVINATVKAAYAVATTVKAILTGIIKMGKKIFGAVKKKLVEVTVNPYDVKEINGSDGNHTINGFYNLSSFSATQYPLLKAKLNEGPIHCDFIPCEIILQKHESKNVIPEFTDITTAFNVISTYKGKTLDVSRGLLDGLKSAFGVDYSSLVDATKNITGINFDYTTEKILDVLNTYRNSVMNDPELIDVLYKIKPIKYDYVCNQDRDFVGEFIITEGVNTRYEYGIINIKTVLDSIVDGPDPYTSVDRSEIDLYRDFMAGYLLTLGLMSILKHEAEGTSFDYAVLTFNESWIKAINNGFTKVTNKDFFDIASNGSVKILDNWHMPVSLNGSDLASALENVFAYREENPYDFSFWPYSRNYVSWFDSSFELVSDGESAERFANFLAKAILIAAVVTIAAKSFLALKRATNKAMAQFKGAEWNLTDLASRGQNIDGALKIYKKSRLKYSILSKLTTGLLVFGSSTATSLIDGRENIAVDLSPVISLIK